MVGAYTTAATINYGACRPDDAVSALEFMPNHAGHSSAPEWEEMDDDAWEAKAAYQQQMLQKAAEMRAEAALAAQD